MKIVVLLGVVFVVLWWMRGGARRASKGGAPPTPMEEAEPMISCAHCGVHLPKGEAVGTVDGAYCSEAHRLAHGDRDGGAR